LKYVVTIGLLKAGLRVLRGTLHVGIRWPSFYRRL